MSTRMPQPPESFDSTKKLMLEALAKASVELENSVTAFTEQLISFNESLQRNLEEEIRCVNTRLEGCIQTNLDELGYNKRQLIKRLLEEEHKELTSLSDVGRTVREKISSHASDVEQKIEAFMERQIAELKDFLQKPESDIKSAAEAADTSLHETKTDISKDVLNKDEQVRRRLSDKVTEIESLIKQECEKVRESIAIAGERSQHRLNKQREQITSNIDQFANEAGAEVNTRADQGVSSISSCEAQHKDQLNQVTTRWKEQIQEHCQSFNKTLTKLSSVHKENYETELANVAAQARQEITQLSGDAHEKISATRNELEVELRELEREYVQHFEQAMRKFESIVAAQANDKKNSGQARQHKAQKLREQMQTHLQRWGGELVESVKDATQDYENEYNRATDGFHTRIEGARSTAIELLERESRLMQKDIERTIKDFQKDLAELEGELSRIEKAGQDAALTVIACRKAVLSFRGE